MNWTSLEKTFGFQGFISKVYSIRIVINKKLTMTIQESLGSQSSENDVAAGDKSALGKNVEEAHKNEGRPGEELAEAANALWIYIVTNIAGSLDDITEKTINPKAGESIFIEILGRDSKCKEIVRFINSNGINNNQTPLRSFYESLFLQLTRGEILESEVIDKLQGIKDSLEIIKKGLAK